jgi:endonuclease YncB( thermonuclease family)
MLRSLFFAVALAGALVSAHAASPAVDGQVSVVAAVADGDTLTLTSGQRVRLLQIDSPELGECYGRQARATLVALAPVGSGLVLEVDPGLDRVDRFGRLLRYARRGETNLNLELVRRGAAAPYFYESERGGYAVRLLVAARAARAAGRGLWGASPSTSLEPDRQVETRCGQPPTFAPGCDPSYAGACVPPYPPDLDCDDLRLRGLAPVRIVGSDPHRLDGDADGVGCE